MTRPIKSVDLFSCVGCHAFGMKRAGIETISLCENKEWRRNHLRRNFPHIPIYDDVRTFRPFRDRSRDTILIGGPPCQKTSVASAIHGYRSGESLWPEMHRVGLDMEAEWFVVEQPTGNATWEAEVSSDLSRSGYHVARFEFGANDIGAPYLRRRVFLVACPSLQRLEVAWRSFPSALESVKRAAVARGDWNPDSIPSFGMDTWRSEGVDDRRERIEALGDSNPPHMAEVIGRAITWIGCYPAV